MEEETSSLNIEWKKNKGFGETEKITRKTNIKKALEFESTEKKAVTTGFIRTPAELPSGLKKIRKKIKDAYDEDEEEDFYAGMPHDAGSSLLNALYEDEKKQLQQKSTIENQKMQQSAGRLEAIVVADKLSRQAGLSGLDKKIANRSMQDVTLIDNPVESVLAAEIAKKTKTSLRRLSKGETITMLRGINRVRQMAAAADESQLKALEKMKVGDLINAGEKSTDDHKVAEMILKKSGRKDKKQVEKMVQKSKEKSNTTVKSRTNLSAKDIFR